MSFSFKNFFIGAGIAYVVVDVTKSAWSMIRAYPGVAFAAFVGWVAYHAFIVGFGYDVIRVNDMRLMTESQYAQTHDAAKCTREDNSTVCEYHDDTKATFGADDRMTSFTIPAKNFTQDFSLTHDYYKYVLYRMGIKEYYEPTRADMDGIVWNNIPNIREARILTNGAMNTDEVTVEFK